MMHKRGRERGRDAQKRFQRQLSGEEQLYRTKRDRKQKKQIKMEYYYKFDSLAVGGPAINVHGLVDPCGVISSHGWVSLACVRACMQNAWCNILDYLHVVTCILPTLL